MDALINSLAQNYAAAFSEPEDALQAEVYAYTIQHHPHAHMLSGQVQGAFLSIISKLLQPKRVLEIGTFTGDSALCLAEGLADDGILYALEANDELEYLIKQSVEKSPSPDKIKLLIGNALEIIPDLNETFDLVFIDAGKRDYPLYYDLVIDKVRRGGLIIADNILWSGKVVEEKKDIDTQIIDTFNKKIHADDRVENILLPIRDGLMMARKK